MTGAVFAGGFSRRMGAPKEGIPWDGRPMLEHVLDALLKTCGRAAVVGECRGAPVPEGIWHVPDLRPGEGPLAALEALLASGQDEAYLVAACDQPLLSPDLLSRLLCDPPALRFFRAPDGTALDPFPGVFPASLLGPVRAALDRGERSIRRFLSSCAPEWVDIAPEDVPLLQSLNTPEDVAAARARWSPRGETA